MRELVAAATLDKPLVALIDLDESRGGLSLDQIQEQLLEANRVAVHKWGCELTTSLPFKFSIRLCAHRVEFESRLDSQGECSRGGDAR